jgi:alkanesulfonate monooxygenase SsuD/methylene tetrahydromethanopterin reductase-like flavin-dependent oxidoreductase (luciferase family)
MRLGTLILPDKRWEYNAARWLMAEQLGFDSAWTYDHIWWRSLRDSPWFSAVPVLSAAAAMTERLRIGLMVASPNFRHPVTTVKDAIAIDDISGGRFMLGVGSGASSAGDAEVLGGEPLSPRERSARFAEFVELAGQLLDNPVVSYAGRHYGAKDARMIPGSVQQPRLPLAIAASGRTGIALAARYGDTQAGAWGRAHILLSEALDLWRRTAGRHPVGVAAPGRNSGPGGAEAASRGMADRRRAVPGRPRRAGTRLDR